MIQKGDAQAKLAIADQDSTDVHVFDVRSGSSQPMETFCIHRAPVTAMRYNAQHDTVISIDERGVLEYWSASTHEFPRGQVSFSSSLDTDLYACAKAKATTRSISLSQDGSQFAIFSSDRCMQHGASACENEGVGREREREREGGTEGERERETCACMRNLWHLASIRWY